ncbi:crossover junction endonuclease MUS81 [Palaemon carinicauda]|uniref:crossover junction endonuclease MUS81 n=1 Tax=Palaemon carinicauda TaxID=392227 RepID=UPI0035B68514
MSLNVGKSLPSKKYRRKKKVVRHSNPLFDEWLAEWEREAANIGSNMRFNYRRARNSLKLYPLPVYRGKDCKVLAHFGDKICQMLDQKLNKYIDENGPIVWEEIHKVMASPASKKRPRKRTVRKNIAPAEKNTEDTSGVTSDPITSPTGRGKGRPYIPSFRSGAYALLITLYSNTRESDVGFMKKKELMEAAQPLCNASFTHASDGSHYTAWSSMSVLIKKSLVVREGNPSRYSLTHDGKALAVRLIAGADTDSYTTSCILTSTADRGDDVVTLSSRSCSPSSLSGSPVKKGMFLESNTESDSSLAAKECLISGIPKSKLISSDMKGKEIQRKRKNNFDDTGKKLGTLDGKSCGSLIFSYVTSLEMETPLKDKAVVSVEDDGFLGFLIKCRLSDLRNSGLSYRIDSDRTAPLGFTYAYLSNECAPNQSPGLLSPRQKKPAISRIPALTDVKSEDTGKSLSSKIKLTARSVVSSKPSVSLLDDIVPKHDLQGNVNSTSLVKRFCAEPLISSKPLFSLTPGMYEIVLCVDNAETTGGFQGMAKFNIKEIFINELKKHKVQYDVRKLHVGDFMWIARERCSLQSCSEPRELVLPYVVERKRMDDLAKSIKDGRFKEQKFRLKQSGLSNPIYLVEEYGSQNLSLPEATCLQAVTNTQVVDGFTVKITKDQIESAAFLTIMTRCLQSRYQGKTLRNLELEELQRRERSMNGEVIETALVPFKDFNAASMKNHQLSVKEMFVKHLLQLHGLSLDKAKAVVDKFETPAAMMLAYESLENPMESENMLASIKCGKAGRNFGSALSMHIAKLYTNLML